MNPSVSDIEFDYLPGVIQQRRKTLEEHIIKGRDDREFKVTGTRANPSALQGIKFSDTEAAASAHILECIALIGEHVTIVDENLLTHETCRIVDCQRVGSIKEVYFNGALAYQSIVEFAVVKES